MTSQTVVEGNSIRERVDFRVDRPSQPNIPALNSLALGSLLSLFNEKEKLFSESISLSSAGLRRGRTSRKLTAIALLGLQRLQASGARHPFDLAPIQDAVWQDRRWIKSIEDLGLLTWFTAACRPERLGSLFHDYDFGRAIAAYPDARDGRTTGLAWFLAGIAHARIVCPNTALDLTDIAVETYHLLEDNQGEGGIFGHAAFPRFRPQALQNRVGTFADQIYAIYALATFARAFQIEEPLGPALGCANSIRALQGELGQWWFLYDKCSGRVVNRYPVFSAHQNGLAPLGLLTVGESTGQSFQESVYKGLAWVNGANELGTDLRDLDRRLIWNSIGANRRSPNFWEAALSLMNISREPRAQKLTVRCQDRPDHFGWLLYAFGSSGLPKAMTASAAARTR
ncbi:MAG: hypothetical protein WBF35_05630 [Candidatus Acidiferrales bacterium]